MKRAFTLTEMMVALAITSVIVVSINRVFSITADVVSIGAATSDVYAAARIIGDQLDADAKEMTGPSEGGFMVIVGEKLDDVDIDIAGSGAVIETRNVRTDQLLFIRSRGSLEPMVPQAENSYDTKSVASHVRVWYGHVVQTAPDGTLAGGAGLGDDNNKYGSDFVLGRQALFLQAVDGTGQQALPNTAGDKATGAYLADFSNGMPDVVKLGLAVEGPEGAVVSWSSTAGSNSDQLLVNASGSDYFDNALKYTFKGEVFGCNPTPPATPDDPYISDEVAKMHPYLAGGVSQFIVEFAGDYDASPGLDMTGGSPNQIKWYGFETGNTPSLGTAGQSPINQDDDYVFRHGTGPTNWPMAIRVRFRVHDANAKVSGRDTGLGRWFEQILPVNRD